MKMVFVSIPRSLSEPSRLTLLHLGTLLREIEPDFSKIKIGRETSYSAVCAVTSLLAGYSCTAVLEAKQLTQGTDFTDATDANFRKLDDKKKGANLFIVISNPEYANGYYLFRLANLLCLNAKLLDKPITPDRLLVFDDKTQLFSFIE